MYAMVIAPPATELGLANKLRAALRTLDTHAMDALASMAPVDTRDRFETLLIIYALHVGPIDEVGEAARLQHHPTVAAIKQRCESQWLAELDALPEIVAENATDTVKAMRALAARDRLPPIYVWVAREASWDEVVAFLIIDGGPDGGFDDLVAICQVGLSGSAKVELATNYWDEMGEGDPIGVHTHLYDRLMDAIALPPRTLAPEQPVSGLARAALGGLLATNRWLQPEMLGALGLIELQAGPRCQLVLQALARCDAPPDAYPFYQVHADVDPRHGKDWLEKAIVPLVTANPAWAPRIVRGAQWRSEINSAFLVDVTDQMIPMSA
jgi:Iron-containing redox enzyme